LGGSARSAAPRPAALAGAALVTAESICERWSVLRAGFQSAARPQDTIDPQRARIDRAQTRGAVRRASCDGKVDAGLASPATHAAAPTATVEG
jgi:hypothetical protein